MKAIDKVVERIDLIHQILAPARALIPPPLVGLGLILYAAELAHGRGRCFVCGRAETLVEDHCHHTQQVRAELCRSCNTLEGFGSNAQLWSAYRSKAPGVGLYVPYSGRGACVPNWPAIARTEWPATVLNYTDRAIQYLDWAACACKALPPVR
jgi:hypothetical protein